MNEHELICDADVLERCAEEWLRLPVIGLDTEFERQKSFYPVPALVQFSDGDRHWLLDPLALSDMTPLRRLLCSPDTVKVFHSCSEDMQVLRQLCGAAPTPVFDTQIAAALLGKPLQTSYSKFVQDRFGVELADDQTRSDWLQRPLSAEQLSYAVEDVRWLLPLHRELSDELQALGRLEWLQEDCARLAGRVDAPATDTTLLRRFKNFVRPGGDVRRLLLRLCRWRDAEARRKNRIRKYILRDDLLLEVARQSPDTEQELAAILGRALSGSQRRELLRLCVEQKQRAAQEEADEKAQAELRVRSRALCRQMQEEVVERAAELGIEPALLISRDECREAAEFFCGSGRLPEKLQNGWRHRMLNGIFSGLAQTQAAGMQLS